MDDDDDDDDDEDDDDDDEDKIGGTVHNRPTAFSPQISEWQ